MFELIGIAVIVLAVALGVYVHNVGLKNAEARLGAKIDKATTAAADAVKKV